MFSDIAYSICKVAVVLNLAECVAHATHFLGHSLKFRSMLEFGKIEESDVSFACSFP